MNGNYRTSGQRRAAERSNWAMGLDALRRGKLEEAADFFHLSEHPLATQMNRAVGYLEYPKDKFEKAAADITRQIRESAERPFYKRVEKRNSCFGDDTVTMGADWATKIRDLLLEKSETHKS